jgi:hypothetical protein
MFKTSIKNLDIQLKYECVDSTYAFLFESELKKNFSDQIVAFNFIKESLKKTRTKYFSTRLNFSYLRLPYFLCLIYLFTDTKLQAQLWPIILFMLIPLVYFIYLKILEKKLKSELLGIVDKLQVGSKIPIGTIQIDNIAYGGDISEVGEKAMENLFYSLKYYRFRDMSIGKIKDKDISIYCALICMSFSMVYTFVTDGLETNAQAIIEYFGSFCGWLSFSMVAFLNTEKYMLKIKQSIIIEEYCDLRDMYYYFLNSNVDSYDKKIINELAKTHLYRNMDSFFIIYINRFK